MKSLEITRIIAGHKTYNPIISIDIITSVNIKSETFDPFHIFANIRTDFSKWESGDIVTSVISIYIEKKDKKQLFKLKSEFLSIFCPRCYMICPQVQASIFYFLITIIQFIINVCLWKVRNQKEMRNCKKKVTHWKQKPRLLLI